MRGLHLVLVALLLAGCASPSHEAPAAPPEPAWDSDSIPPAWTVSLDYVWAEGTKVEWTWRSGPQDVQFQVLHPSGGTVQRIADVRGNASASGFTVPEDGQYSIYWVNPGSQDANLQRVVPEGYVYERWPPGKSMGCGSRTDADAWFACLGIGPEPGLPALA